MKVFKKLGLVLMLLVLVACDSTPQLLLEPPTNISATPGPGYITVTWQDNSPNESGFIVYRSEAGSAVKTQAGTKLGEVGPDIEEFIDFEAALDTDYLYQVAAKVSTGETSSLANSDSSSQLKSGVDLMMGTISRHPFEDSTGTAFVLYFFFPHENLKLEEFSFTLTGPAGWRNDEPYTATFNQEFLDLMLADGWFSASDYNTDAVAGDYTLTVKAKDKTYVATATLADPKYKFTPPDSITVSEVSPTQVSASWTAAAGVISYTASIYLGTYQKFIANSGELNTTSTTFTDLRLDPGNYIIEVVSFPIDITGYPLKLSPYGIAFDFEPFTLALPDSQFFKVDPVGAYLPRDVDDPAKPATALTLESLAAVPGECLAMVQVGAYSAGVGREDTSGSMIAVFQGADGFLNPGPKSKQEAITSRVTPSGLETDIVEDFNLTSFATLEVPVGATELLFSPDDSYHSDNTDPNGDYGVSLLKVDCP